ncbi:hypothetical protein H6A32_13150 [Drancourtella massiliensis]|uniref:Uncharacterized protein n=1 Tax=Drancourtella massiliensis TaxID=1632013 RepID=A0ABS2EK63_9FIRM|nr:hypothetical protein [Drancourtella massiliensis]MBM6745231.1 hypothetical protein [Drancourtella massiliensis]
MKPEEATKILKSTLSLIYQTNISFEDSVDYKEASDIAIRAIKEVQQYREIGTVEECRKAVEKQIPKKIIIEPYCPTECPTCGHELSTSLGDGYYKYPTFLKRCPNCGQAIQW